jgi:hypothetical protein
VRHVSALVPIATSGHAVIAVAVVGAILLLLIVLRSET